MSIVVVTSNAIVLNGILGDIIEGSIEILATPLSDSTLLKPCAIEVTSVEKNTLIDSDMVMKADSEISLKDEETISSVDMWTYIELVEVEDGLKVGLLAAK